MNYLIYGLEDYLIKKQVFKILKENNLSTLSINNYDLTETKIEDVLLDAATISLFDESKVLICDNAYFLTSSTKKMQVEHDLNKLSEYLINKNSLTTIIFIAKNESLDERKKIVKSFRKYATIIECNKPNNIEDYVLDMFKDYEIERSIIKTLINRVGENLSILENEVEKIKLYKFDEKKILEEDVINLTDKNIDIDIFHLIENIVNNNKEKTLESLNEMLKQNEEPIKIIIMLANQFRLIYQAKELYSKGYTEKDISSILKVHPYRIKLALSKGRFFKSSVLLDYIEKLADLDIKIKSGEVSKELALELFILEL